MNPTIPPSPTGLDAFFTENNIITIISSVSPLFLVIPALAGAGLGLRECASGISGAAEIKIEFTSVMATLCFLTSPVIYMLLTFFMFNIKAVNTVSDAFLKLTGCAITGFGCYYTASTCGSMAKHVLITKAKEKKFSGQFYLGFVFVEFIGLFGLIISLLLQSQLGK